MQNLIFTLLGALVGVSVLAALRLWLSGPLQRRAGLLWDWLRAALLIGALLLAAMAVERVFEVKTFAAAGSRPDWRVWLPVLFNPLPSVVYLVLADLAVRLVRGRRLLTALVALVAVVIPLTVPLVLVHEDLGPMVLHPRSCIDEAEAWYVPIAWRERSMKETVLLGCTGADGQVAEWREARTQTPYAPDAATQLCTRASACNWLAVTQHQWLPSLAVWRHVVNGQWMATAHYQGDLRQVEQLLRVENLVKTDDE